MPFDLNLYSDVFACTFSSEANIFFSDGGLDYYSMKINSLAKLVDGHCFHYL